MKSCIKCGELLSKNATFCPKCNKLQPKKKETLKIVLIVICGLIFVGAVGSYLSEYDDNSNSSDKSAQSRQEEKNPEMGETITIKDVDYIVNEKKIQKVVKANDYFKYTADGSFLLIKITITNNSKNPINIDSTDFTLKDENDARYSASILSLADDMFLFETINPNATKTGYIAYDIANTDLHYTLTLHGDSFFDFADIKVSIQ